MNIAHQWTLIAATVCSALFANPLCVQAETVGTDYLVSRSLADAASADSTDSSTSPTSASPARQSLVQQPKTSESSANTLEIPGSILDTGTDVHSATLSPNAVQLANQLGVLVPLQHAQEMKTRGGSAASLPERVELLETREHISEILRTTEMEVNFVLSEIYDEQSLYSDIMSSYTSQRDKAVAVTNAVSFGTNGILWAIAEAFDAPTNKYPNLSVPSGTIGILAGIVPSIASALTLKEVNGRKHSAPAAPNMLAKLFDRPTNKLIEYPNSVWTFLNAVPAGDADAKPKRRRDSIIDRWVSDKNIPSFTDRSSQSQIDVVTASARQNKTLTIAVLSTRITLLQQLASEIYKMNRLLLELEMVLEGSKQV